MKNRIVINKSMIKKAVKAAQGSYIGNPEYGLSDYDMKKAIIAALVELSLVEYKK